MTNETIKSLAKQMSEAFEGGTRTNGDEFRKLKEGSPQWMTDVCFAAHDAGAILPDDVRYAFIEEAVDALADFECDEGEEDEARDSIEPSIYTGDLTGWLHSRVSRIGYMDEATEELGLFNSISDHLMAAQKMEMDEVFYQVLKALRGIVDAQEEEEESDDE